MQNALLKIIRLFLFIVITQLPYTTSAQSLRHHLAKADSLFIQKRYTQSLDLYTSVLNQGQYTPAMFLKMAFIEEGLNHAPQAMYYLNLYYLVTQDERAAIKIKEFASAKKWEGYEFDDPERFMGLYHRYHTLIALSLMAVCAVILFFLVLQRVRTQKVSIGLWIILVIFSTMLAVHINFPVQYRTGIVAGSNTYLMSGPSAGASVVQIIDEGHRVRIMGKQDVWLKVQWRDKEAYIRQDRLLPVVL
ncbi:MAG: hypothetical protein KF845_05615 [Cyclobacteriaceae bacterium]|nr:hypothetical protein [Cyclobacteriaceae bacterium]